MKRFLRRWFRPSLTDELEWAIDKQRRRVIEAELKLIAAKSIVAQEQATLRYLQKA